MSEEDRARAVERLDDITVVIDIGSQYVRGGIAGEDKPRCELKTVFKTEKTAETEPQCTANLYPIERGCVRDWTRVESLLQSVYAHLHVGQDTRHALLLTRHMFDPVADAAHFVQFAIESLNASDVSLVTQPVLTLYANGRTDGVVLDCGDGVTQVVPVFEGYAIDNATLRQDLAGNDVSLTLRTMLTNRRPEAAHVDLETSREIKEKLCFVSSNFDQEVETSSNKFTRSYALPGGDVINVGEERFRSPEILFNPSLIGSEYLGLSKLVHKSVSACPIDLRGHLLERIIMAGGTTKTPGICRRLLKDLSSLSPRCHVRVTAGAGRQHSAWRGGSVLASLPSFISLCISKQEYMEHGAAIVRKKLH